MYIADLEECEEFWAGDNCRLRELLHPDKSPLELRYSLARAIVEPGQATVLHRLKESSEVYYIINGEGLMHIEGESATVRQGQSIYIPPGSKQYIENTSDRDLEFLCIVDPAWQAGDEEVF